jgi:hypothetical protein
MQRDGPRCPAPYAGAWVPALRRRTARTMNGLPARNPARQKPATPPARPPVYPPTCPPRDDTGGHMDSPCEPAARCDGCSGGVLRRYCGMRYSDYLAGSRATRPRRRRRRTGWVPGAAGPWGRLEADQPELDVAFVNDMAVQLDEHKAPASWHAHARSLCACSRACVRVVPVPMRPSAQVLKVRPNGSRWRTCDAWRTVRRSCIFLGPS